jgi:hypothetical protein
MEATMKRSDARQAAIRAVQEQFTGDHPRGDGSKRPHLLPEDCEAAVDAIISTWGGTGLVWAEQDDVTDA